MVVSVLLKIKFGIPNSSAQNQYTMLEAACISPWEVTGKWGEGWRKFEKEEAGNIVWVFIK